MVFTRNVPETQPVRIHRSVGWDDEHPKGGAVITANQIEYAKLLETRRANQTLEALTRLRDQTTRDLGFSQLAETARANVAKEGLNRASLDETTRANMAKESQQLLTLSETQRANLAREGETKRANMSQEDIKRAELAEAIRMHGVNETLASRAQDETARHNVATEGISSAANQARITQSLIGLSGIQAQVDLGRQQLDEQRRSNLARESETHRANVTKEGETIRSNLAKEAELLRSHRASEDAKSRELDLKTASTVFEGVRTTTGGIRDVISSVNGLLKAGAAVIAMGG